MHYIRKCVRLEICLILSAHIPQEMPNTAKHGHKRKVECVFARTVWLLWSFTSVNKKFSQLFKTMVHIILLNKKNKVIARNMTPLEMYHFHYKIFIYTFWSYYVSHSRFKDKNTPVFHTWKPMACRPLAFRPLRKFRWSFKWG